MYELSADIRYEFSMYSSVRAYMLFIIQGDGPMHRLSPESKGLIQLDYNGTNRIRKPSKPWNNGAIYKSTTTSKSNLIPVRNK